MSRICELFAFPVGMDGVDWKTVVENQYCPYSRKRCFKVRKSRPDVSIGTCTVGYGRDGGNVAICPNRLLERGQIFADCLHLLTCHQPGNELHLVPEVAIPGGNVDYFLVSTDTNRKVKDFVGIELQTLDTTGTIWPERQLALREMGLAHADTTPSKPFGINWKMTAKTILLQLHHKIETFEHVNKHLVLVVQDCLLDYIKREFSFEHLNPQAALGDPMHIHSYQLRKQGGIFKMALAARYSTDSIGISRLLGLNANAKIGLETMAKALEERLSDSTVFSIR